MTTLTKAQHLENINKVIDSVKYAMMTTITSDEKHLHACPMTTNKNDLENGKIWFIGDKKSETVQDLAKNPQVNLSYTSADQKDFVSINGVAELVDDKTKLDELWSPIYNAFYEKGKEDPNVQVIGVTCNGAQYWLSGNSVVNMFKLVSAAMQEGKTADNMGENHAVTF
ncbi:MAG: pyridoxamine 5'-phosphate oxidase family protein [Moraxella sp.]|jgi:general stress protein 26